MTPHPSSDQAIFTWGKHKGYSLSHVFYNNQSYLTWVTQTDGIPSDWKQACQLTLEGKDISHLNVARATTTKTTATQQHPVSRQTAVTMYLVNNKVTAVEMPYNPPLMAKFKYEIDGRTWNTKEKRWEFPTVHLVKAFEVFGEANITCDEKVRKALSELKERREDLDEIRDKEDDEDFVIDGLQLDLYGYQRLGVKFVERAGGRALIADQPGLGKAQPLDSKVLTPTGWKCMGDIKVGDEVMTPQNTIATVVAEYPQGEKDIYKIWFNDRTYVESCLDHLWHVRTKYGAFAKTPWKTLSTGELLDDMTRRNRKWEIPQTIPVDFPTKSHQVVHPYLLGILLGDGGLTGGRVNITTKDPELIETVRTLLPENTTVKPRKHSRGIGYVIVRTDGGNTSNVIKTELIRMNVMGKYSYEKEIPANYMVSSLSNRIELFQGLMDTDGWFLKNTGALQYGSTSEKLARQVKELIESFGGTARVNSKIAKLKGVQHRRFYTLTIALPNAIQPFKLQRKLNIYTPRTKYFPKRRIVKIEFSRQTEAKCISLDKNGPLYITDNYTVTHNTAQAIAYSQHKKLKTLIVCPLSVVVNWERQIKLFTGKNSTIWDAKGKVGHSNAQFHIVHYDAVGKIVNDLIGVGFDLLVCDEATFLKNRQTIRAKSVLGSWKERKKYPGIKTKHTIFLTGTPVMSRPIEAYHLLNFLDKDRFNNFYHFVQRYGGWRGDAPRNLDDLHERTKDLVIRRQKKQIQKELPDKQRNDLYVELTKAEKKEYEQLLMDVFGRWKVERPSVAHMPKLQGFLMQKKLPRLMEMIDEYLDNDRPILIFSNYLDPLKTLADHYGDKAALLTGEMKKTERQTSIDRLSTGQAKVGLFSLTAAGMGIDGLQHQIDTVVFLGMDWVPANHEQAEDRTHRIGQKNKVQVFYMVCADTIDEYMRDILKEKQRVADLIVDGAAITPERGKSFFKEFVKKINEFYQEGFSLEIDDQ